MPQPSTNEHIRMIGRRSRCGRAIKDTNDAWQSDCERIVDKSELGPPSRNLNFWMAVMSLGTRPELSRKGFGGRIIAPFSQFLKRDGARWGSPDTSAALHLRERAD